MEKEFRALSLKIDAVVQALAATENEMLQLTAYTVGGQHLHSHIAISIKCSLSIGHLVHEILIIKISVLLGGKKADTLCQSSIPGFHQIRQQLIF